MNLDNILSQSYRDVFNAIEVLALNRLTNSPDLAPGTDTKKFKVGAFSYMLDGVVYNKASADDIAAPGFSTEAAEFRKVLLCIDSAGTITTVGGEIAASQALAEAPEPTADTLPIGILELPASFTSGSTSITSGMCKDITHSISVIEA